PHVLVRRRHFHIHDGLEECGPCLLDRRLETVRAGQLERHLVRVDGVMLAIDTTHAHVHHGVAGERTSHESLLHALFDGRDQVARNRATHDLIHKLKTAAAGKRLDREVADTEHPLSPGLLLELALHFLYSARDDL